MASFSKNFKPTKRERMEVCMRFFRSYMDSKENRTCSTCIHRKFVQGARDSDMIIVKNTKVTKLLLMM